MSQRIAYDIIKELGGQATIPEIRKIIRERYPGYTLDQYLANRLRSLVNKGCLRYDHKLRSYRIVDTFD
jgi:hypothetical protein